MLSKGEYDYDYDDLLRAYDALGIAAGKTIYVASDLLPLMRYREPGREPLLSAHLRAFRELLGPNGTLLVPTASLNLCNTEIVFDLRTTPSVDMGLFAEYVRTRSGAIRSFHPFWSLSGVGPAAGIILGDVSRHSYGWGSAFQRLVEHDVLGVNIGKSPRFSISVIHHIETVMGVPYRYNKEFMHPVVRDGTVAVEPFYLSVLYRECDIVRDQNMKIFDQFRRNGVLREVRLGRGSVWSFSHREFFDVVTRFLQKDMYGWLRSAPQNRPYRR